MTSRSPRRRDREIRREMLANWLALLALLALGIVWPGEESAGVAAAQGPRNPVQGARSAGHGTTNLQQEASVAHALR